MSPTARLLTVLLLLVGAGLFLSALGQEDNGADPVAAEPEKELPAARTWRAADPGVLDSHETCRECHQEIYEEWERDRHSQAWVGELYGELSKQRRDANCWSCHAPRPILETGLDAPAEARANFRESGINCLTCHKSGNHVVGPYDDPEDTPEVRAACGPRFGSEMARESAQKATTVFCGVCHNLHGTDKEFEASQYFRDGKTCLSCHMEEAMGPIAKGGKTRRRRVHFMPGGHSPAMLKKAMSVKAEIKEGQVVARVYNDGAGHRIPTDARHRGIYLQVAFFDRFDQPVPVANPESGAPERETTMDLIRLFYRHEQKDPTQIVPLGTIGQDNWRESSIAIPDGAKGGHARLRLYYLLNYAWRPMSKGTLVQEMKVDLD